MRIAEIHRKPPGGAVAFEEHSNATRDGGAVPSFYENMIANDTQRPLMIFNREQNLYYFLRGPRQTPSRRQYPLRTVGGLPIESQPEKYYATTQAVDVARINGVIDPYHIRVNLSGMVAWPQNPPYYLYLAQRVTIEDYPAFRYVKVFEEEVKVKVIGVEDDIVHINLPLTLDNVEDNIYYLVFFENSRLIDILIDTPLVLFAGDETFRDVTLGDIAPIIASPSTREMTIEITSTYRPENTFIGADFSPLPQIGDKFLVITRADSTTIVNYEEVEVKAITLNGLPIEIPIYEDDPSYIIDEEGLFVEDPFEEQPEDPSIVPGANFDPYGDRVVIGKLSIQKWDIVLKESAGSMNTGDELAQYSYTELTTSDISDEELAIPLPGTEWSLQPHTFHMLAPLKGLAYMNVYGYNWGLPLPYPEETAVYDCLEPIPNGFLTPKELSKHRMGYSRAAGYWKLGGTATIFPTVREFADGSQLEEAMLNLDQGMFFKSTNSYWPIYARRWI